MRVAIVHYWLMRHGGGERVVGALADMFPQADIFAVVAQEGATRRFAGHRVITSFLQRVPGSVRYHRHFLPLYPLAVEQFDLRGYDLVISSDSGPAKGVITSTAACHVAYCHSPMRYLWDFYHDYVHGREMRGISRLGFAALAHYMRLWDLAAAARVDHFVANSANVAARIRKHYRREATVVYPPVDMRDSYISNQIEDYYLAVGRLVDYKRFDLAIQACQRLHRSLRIVGDGPQMSRLRRIAGPRTQFLGAISDQQLRHQYAHCRALLFPGAEDFGIVPVEAQCFGRPVIAFGRGGAVETVAHVGENSSVPTGLLFGEQTVESLCAAILAFEAIESDFSPPAIARRAARFSTARFENAMHEFLRDKLGLAPHSHPVPLPNPALVSAAQSR